MTRARDVANIDGLLTTTGDTYYASAAGTPARLGIGSSAQVLTVSGGVPSWATPASSSGPAFRVFLNTTNQTVTADTWTKVQFNAETFDTDNCFDSSTNYRFTPTKAGYYLFNLAVLGIAETGKFVHTTIYKNGSAYGRGVRVGSTLGEGLSTNNALIYLNGSTDYVEGYGYVNAGTVTEAFVADSTVTYFEGIWVRS